MDIIIAHLAKVQKKDSIARIVQKKLALPNINIYYDPLGKPLLRVKRVFYYDNKPYILKTIRPDLLKMKHDNL